MFVSYSQGQLPATRRFAAIMGASARRCAPPSEAKICSRQGVNKRDMQSIYLDPKTFVVREVLLERWRCIRSVAFVRSPRRPESPHRAAQSIVTELARDGSITRTRWGVARPTPLTHRAGYAPTGG
jgi:hypothetical protein